MSKFQRFGATINNRPVGDALRYFQNRSALMHYAEARFHGLPIGSGAVEARRRVQPSKHERDGCRRSTPT